MGVFAYSWIHPPTIPARLARKFEGKELCARRLQYTNYLTAAWIVFFAANALIAIATAVFFSREIWALYTGLISYLLIALMFGGEYVYRQCVLEPKLKRN